MQIQLISIRLERPFTDAEVERLLRLVPPERRQRLAHLKDPMVGHEPICAYAALWLGLNALYGWRELPALTYNKYGKPAFAEHPEVQFNLSHTRGAVLVGIIAFQEPVTAPRLIFLALLLVGIVGLKLTA